MTSQITDISIHIKGRSDITGKTPEDEAIAIEESRCIGCGNCVTVCPSENLSMVRRFEKSPPEGDGVP